MNCNIECCRRWYCLNRAPLDDAAHTQYADTFWKYCVHIKTEYESYILILWNFAMLCLGMYSLFSDSWLVANVARQGLIQGCKLKTPPKECFNEGDCSVCVPNNRIEVCGNQYDGMDEVITGVFVVMSIIARFVQIIALLFSVCEATEEEDKALKHDLVKLLANLERLASSCDLVAIVVYFSMNLPPNTIIGKFCAHFGNSFFLTIARILPTLLAVFVQPVLAICNQCCGTTKTLFKSLNTQRERIRKCSCCCCSCEISCCLPLPSCGCCGNAEGKSHKANGFLALWHFSNLVTLAYCLFSDTWIVASNDVARQGILTECKLGNEINNITTYNTACVEHNFTPPTRCATRFSSRNMKSLKGPEIFVLVLLVIFAFVRLVMFLYFLCVPCYKNYDEDTELESEPWRAMSIAEDSMTVSGVIAAIVYYCLPSQLPGNLCHKHSWGFWLFVFVVLLGFIVRVVFQILYCLRDLIQNLCTKCTSRDTCCCCFELDIEQVDTPQGALDHANPHTAEPETTTLMESNPAHYQPIELETSASVHA